MACRLRRRPHHHRGQGPPPPRVLASQSGRHGEALQDRSQFAQGAVQGRHGRGGQRADARRPPRCDHAARSRHCRVCRHRRRADDADRELPGGRPARSHRPAGGPRNDRQPGLPLRAPGAFRSAGRLPLHKQRSGCARRGDLPAPQRPDRGRPRPLVPRWREGAPARRRREAVGRTGRDRCALDELVHAAPPCTGALHPRLLPPRRPRRTPRGHGHGRRIRGAVMPRAISLTTDQTTKEETMSKIVPRGGSLLAATQMKHLAIAASVVAALALSSVALAGGTLAGKYTTTIKSPAKLKGTWVLNLTKGGTYTVDNGQLLVRGKYSATGSKITFGHETGSGACAKSGTYTWKKTATTLKFRRVHDSPLCSGRSGVLAHTFTQQR